MKKLSSAEIKYWRPIVILVLAILWMIFFPLWRDWVTATPLDVPISFSQKIEIHKEVIIRAEENYRLSFIFDENDLPFETMKRLIGAGGLCLTDERPCPKGVPIALSWNFIDQATGSIVVEGNDITLDAHGWSGKRISRTIERVRLPPGKYFFNAETTNSISELDQLHAHISLDFGLKDISSLTFGTALIWGQIAWYLLAPLSIILSISALIRRKYRKRLDAEKTKY